ncbi:MAG: carbon-nitrogen hydrolase family protein [Deltaproteobacteria bacterium]|jgi:predicted amidohydrolase|nr:carbon-nitrogen hydrolase family protein [Deltaproteobacteria bacterium]
MDRPIKVALIQYTVQEKWQDNVNQVERLLTKAHRGGAELSLLPEMFVQPYDMTIVPDRAESVPQGPTSEKLSEWSRRFKMAIVGGSVAELGSDGKYYNTATLWSPEGALLAKHRKIHLFDVDLPNGVSFRESAILSPGFEVTVVRVLGMNIGIAVCYDIRFPELSRLMTLMGAELIALPGAFNNVSGPAHWEILLRTRAAENTVWVAGVSGLASPDDTYQTWGHSMLTDPFGEVVADMGRTEGVSLCLLDPARLEDIRARLPVIKQRREDLYTLTRNDAT